MRYRDQKVCDLRFVPGWIAKPAVRHPADSVAPDDQQPRTVCSPQNPQSEWPVAVRLAHATQHLPRTYQTRSMTNIEIYTLQGCPFCAKVEAKLDELDLEYEEHSVPRSRSERTEVEAVSGQTGVPVLVDHQNGVEGMHESEDIVQYLEEQYGS